MLHWHTVNGGNAHNCDAARERQPNSRMLKQKLDTPISIIPLFIAI